MRPADLLRVELPVLLVLLVLLASSSSRSGPVVRRAGPSPSIRGRCYQQSMDVVPRSWRELARWRRLLVSPLPFVVLVFPPLLAVEAM